MKTDVDKQLKKKLLAKIVAIRRKKYTVIEYQHLTSSEDGIDASHQQKPKNESNKNDNIKNNQSLKIGSSNCGKTYQVNYILLQKQERTRCANNEVASIYIITTSIYQHPNSEAQTSDESQPLGTYGNNAVVFADMLLSQQVTNIDLFFKRGRQCKTHVYTLHLKVNSTWQKNIT